MKRNLNTSYRLVWNDVLGAFVVVSELATARGKRSRTVLAIAVAGLMSTAALAAGNTTAPAGQTVDGAVISNHDTQQVWGSATGTVVNTGQNMVITTMPILADSLCSPVAWQITPR